MYYISQPSGCSLEEHIENLEYLYSEKVTENDIEAAVQTDVRKQINELREKLNKNSFSFKEAYLF